MSAPIPQHTQTIRDGGLGASASAADGLSVKIGSSTLGDAGTFYSYQGSDVQAVFDELGDGPLPHAVAKHLLRSKGKPVLAYKAAPSTAGSSSAVSRYGGSSGPLVTISGAPNDQGEAIVEVVAGGAVATATFKYSLDGGDTFSETLATAATYLLPSGVTVTFPAGTYVAGEGYTWTDTAPALTSSDIGTAMDAVITSPYAPQFVHVLGQAADASGMVTIATLLATKVSSAWASKKYLWAMMEAPAVDKALLLAATAASSFVGVVITAGFEELIDDGPGSRVQKRSSGRVLAPRIARQPIGVHVLQNETETGLSPFEDVVELVPDGAAASTGYHDEDKTPGLNAGRYSTLRTIAGKEGFYPTNALTFSPLSSDFHQLPYLQLILKVAQGWYGFGLENLGRRIRKNPTTGRIDERFARSFEQQGERFLGALMGTSVDAVKVVVNRTDDVSADPTLRNKVRIVTPSYILTLESELGLASSLAA